MALADDETPLERAYPYRGGWKVAGCTALFFGLIGTGGTALISFGCDQVRGGMLPVGIAMMVIGLFGAPMLLLMIAAIAMGFRDAFRPPLLRVTPTALLLPPDLRGTAPEPMDKNGEPLPEPEGGLPPPHPEELPFTAIRWVRREGLPGSQKLLIVHALSAQTLELQQMMMDAAHFDELETVLRAAVPQAFGPAPLPEPAPPEEG
jgi:hypothetical protein